MDILVTALGKTDNPGRVVGKPGRVRASEFFGKKVARSTTKKETRKEMQARIYAEAVADAESRYALFWSNVEAFQAFQQSQQKVRVTLYSYF